MLSIEAPRQHHFCFCRNQIDQLKKLIALQSHLCFKDPGLNVGCWLPRVAVIGERISAIKF